MKRVVLGGFAWRRAKGLLTIGDLARIYQARRFVRPGALCPLPEDLLPRWRPKPGDDEDSK